MNTFAPRGGKVMVLSPDFSMYQFYAEVAELEVVNMLKDGEFMLTEQEVIDRAKAEKPDVPEKPAAPVEESEENT